MNNKHLFHTVLISLASVLLFVSVEYKVSEYINGYGMVLIIAGAFLLYFKDRIVDSMNGSDIADAAIKSVGTIIMFLGFWAYAHRYVEELWKWFFVLGVIIYGYSWQIVSLISKE